MIGPTFNDTYGRLDALVSAVGRSLLSMPVVNESVAGRLPGTVSSFAEGRGLIAGADGGCLLYRDGRRLLWWALGGGVTGMPNKVRRYLPESPEARQLDEVAIEIIDFCVTPSSPSSSQRRGQRGLYVLQREALLRWMPAGLSWLLSGGEWPTIAPLLHRPVPLIHALEPPQSAVRPPLPTVTYSNEHDVRLPPGCVLTPPPSPPSAPPSEPSSRPKLSVLTSHRTAPSHPINAPVTHQRQKGPVCSRRREVPLAGVAMGAACARARESLAACSTRVLSLAARSTMILT